MSNLCIFEVAHMPMDNSEVEYESVGIYKNNHF